MENPSSKAASSGEGLLARSQHDIGQHMTGKHAYERAEARESLLSGC
jgi:hypothetical protein